MSRLAQMLDRLFRRHRASAPGDAVRSKKLRNGSVLILVVALLVLLALMGTAFISTAGTDRTSSTQNTFNTEVDLLLQGVCQVVQGQILTATGGPTDPTNPSSANPNMIWTSPTDSPMLSSRVPTVDQNNNVIWPQISAPAIGSQFESPYLGTTYGTIANNTNYQPTSITIQTADGPQILPAMNVGGKLYLAASASGSGIADSGLVRLPIGQINGITYYAAAFTTDNGSAVNATTAYQPNDSTTFTGEFFPTNVDLRDMLRQTGGSGASISSQLAALNAYRWNYAVGGAPVASLTPIYDNGTAMSFTFSSAYEAMWSQLGRRIDNPGINILSSANSSPIYYQPLCMGDAAALAHRLCLMSSVGSSSIIETSLSPTLTTFGATGTTPIRTSPYGADQTQQFYTDNFNYDAGGNFRPLMVPRNQTSSVTPSLFNNRGAYLSNGIASTGYSFGDWVVNPMSSGGDGCTYVCIQDTSLGVNPGQSPANDSPTTDAELYWTKVPWNDYPVKTNVNTATFGQLWLGYWAVMSAGGPDKPSTYTPPSGASSSALSYSSSTSTPGWCQDPIFRNPIRANLSISGSGTGSSGGGSSSSPTGGNVHVVPPPTGGDDSGMIQGVINGSSPGDTISFQQGTYLLRSTLNLLPDRKYAGGGTPGASVTGGAPYLLPAQTLRLRAALAAINTIQLRNNNSQIFSRQIGLGNINVISGSSVPGQNTGGATLAWMGGNPHTDDGIDHQELFVSTGGTTTEITGFTFTGCPIHLQSGTFNVHGNSFVNCYRGIYVAQASGNYSNNTFSQIDEEGIFGYPGSNGTYNNNVVTTPGNDGIHLLAEGIIQNVTVANNIIINTARIGIEIQNQMYNLNVTGNYASCAQPSGAGNSWMGLSIAVGNGNGINVSGNTIVSSALKGAAVEIMGTNASITNNLSWGFGQFILNGGQGSQVIANGNKVYGGQYVANDFVMWPIAPLVSPEAVYPLNAIAQPQPSASGSAGSSSGGSSTTQPTTSTLTGTYKVTLFGAGQQPYITDIFATNDQASNGGFVAVSIYNPYSTPISLKNWQWATVNRSSGASQLTMTTLSGGPTDLSSLLPSSMGGAIPAGQRILFSSAPAANMPPGVTAGPGVAATVVVPQLTSAFGNELMLIRPHQANGTLSSSTDPTNTYNENTNLFDFIPVDSYDFSTMPQTPSSDDADSVEWHYTRASDPNHPWYFVYPYTYDANTGDNPTPAPPTINPAEPLPMPRLFATSVSNGSSRYAGNPSAVALGAAATTPANSTYANLGHPIQINNTFFSGPNGNQSNSYPYGGFARNGDLLQVTYIGAYRIDVVNVTTNTQTGQTTTTSQPVEYQPITMDAAFADDLDNNDDVAENVGRFCPMSWQDTVSATNANGEYNDYDVSYTNNGTVLPASAYNFATRLPNFMTVTSPADDYMQNVGAETGLARFGIANVHPKYINAYPPAISAAVTEDNAPIDGLININTANWRVLAALNMAESAADNETLAKAIVHYRDTDRGDGQPHGPFKSLLELNGVPSFRTTLGTTALNGFSSAPTSQNAQSYGPNGNDRGPLDGDFTPVASQVPGDFEKQFLAFNRISNLVTLRSDAFTTYVLVQGFRNAGTATPELVVQRRAAFITDRSRVTPSNKVLNVTNVPVGN